MVLSNPYLDASGAGKVVSLSRTIFEGRTAGALPCTSHNDCKEDGQLLSACYNDIGLCAGGDINCFCATPRVHGVMAIDVLYSTLHRIFQAALAGASCGTGNSCYLVDFQSNLLYADGFVKQPITAERAYEQIGLSRVQGGIMKALIQRKLFVKEEHIDFQGQCNSGPRFDKVTTDGLPDNLPPQEQDELKQFIGPLRPSSVTFG